MEEVRFTMNRLMGPKGVLEDHERYKFLLQRGDEEEVQQKPLELEAGNASKKMHNANNDYFYNDTRGGGAAAKGGNQQFHVQDDDFWYGNDKGADIPLANNEYQAYIANTQHQDTFQGKKGNSKQGSRRL